MRTRLLLTAALVLLWGEGLRAQEVKGAGVSLTPRPWSKPWARAPARGIGTMVVPPGGGKTTTATRAEPGA